MAVNERLQRLFELGGVRYDVVTHQEVFGAHNTAEQAHIPEQRLAKVVVLRDAAGMDVMVVLPASYQVDRRILHRVTGRTSLELENEQELKRLFPDCELGAMPPFGHLYGMTMHVDPCLAEASHFYFPAGNHHELVRMSYRDFERLARPFLCESCLHKEVLVVSG